MTADGSAPRPVGSDRRLLGVVLVGLLLLAPPTVLRLACVGETCARASSAAATSIPFCSLSPRARGLIEAGFYEGRSPDVLAVTDGVDISGGSGSWPESSAVSWSSTLSDTRVPIIFSGVGVGRAAVVPAGTGLVQVAPTIAEAIGFRRPFPHVRSGRAIAGAVDGSRPRLVVEIALQGVGTYDVEHARTDWPRLRALLRVGAGTMYGTTGSLPLDPAATLTTIGTGGLPAEHGITGGLLRNTEGKVVPAWGAASPVSVIATLPDDLDARMHGRPLVGLVTPSSSDRGIVGGTWYSSHDDDLIARAANPVAAERRAAGLLRRGFGRDRVPDVLAVVLQGDRSEMDSAVGRIVRDARSVSSNSVLFVVAGSGSEHIAGARVSGRDVVSAVEATSGPLVEDAVPGGLFLDQHALAAAGTTGAGTTDTLRNLEIPDGRHLMADAFQAYAVSLGSYC